MVHPSLPVKNVQELVALAKAKPGTLNFGSSGIGSTNHLAGELLKRMTGIDIVHVPYKGAAPAMNDLIAGHIPMMFDNMPAVLPQVQGGSVRAIAVAGARRASALPDVPTVAEQGVEGFEAFSWFGLVAPAKTPAPVLETLQREAETILKMPDVQKRLAELGADPGTISGAEFGKIPRRRHREMDEDHPGVGRDRGVGPQSGASEFVMNSHRPAPGCWWWFDDGLRAGLESPDRSRKPSRFGELEIPI